MVIWQATLIILGQFKRNWLCNVSRKRRLKFTHISKLLVASKMNSLTAHNYINSKNNKMSKQLYIQTMLGNIQLQKLYIAILHIIFSTLFHWFGDRRIYKEVLHLKTGFILIVMLVQSVEHHRPSRISVFTCLWFLA